MYTAAVEDQIHRIFSPLFHAASNTIENGGQNKMESSNCDTCAYNVYDEDDASYYCEANMDEDDAVRMMERQHRACPFYRNGDEYAVVRKQI